MNMKRMRGRNHRPNSGGGGGSGFRNQQNGIPLNRNHVFDSSGPEMRVRGTAQQLYDKYQQLARDAFSNGDRVTGEAYYQHAEHYFRIISAINQATGTPNQPQSQQNGQPYQQNGQDRGNYERNGQDRSNYNSDRDYSRRDHNVGDVSTEPQPEFRAENRGEQRPQEPRFQEPRRFEARYNNGENRNNEQRNNESRSSEQRNNEPRNNEFRTPKPEFQRHDRQDRYRPAPVQPEAPAIDPRIDISSALEAELAATVAEPTLDLAGFGEQPAIQARTEPRAIPIIPDSPPPVAAEAAAEPAAKTPRPRGRPKTVKPETANE
jgi:hypothetical protein